MAATYLHLNRCQESGMQIYFASHAYTSLLFSSDFFIIHLFLYSPPHLCEAALAKALSQFCINGILTVQIEKIEIWRHVFEGC